MRWLCHFPLRVAFLIGKEFIAGVDEEAKRPGTASFMAPYTPGGHYQVTTAVAPWKWSRIDNNVPKNIRSVLLKPIRPPSRAATPHVENAHVSILVNEIKGK